ncbi:MAG: glycosyltransferase [Gemmatimonadetes bacterium]|nr:glycosyltransferase [Gemmatimonadota bacterium]
MKVLFLAPQPYFIDRGTPIDVDIMARALSDHGHQVDLVCYPDGRERNYDGLTVHRVRAPNWLRGSPPGFSLRKVGLDLLMAPLAFRLARRGQYDVVHAGEEAVFLAMALKRVFGLPYVYDMDSSIAQQLVEQMGALGPLASVFDWFEGRAIRGALAAAPVCNALAELAHAQRAAFVETLHDISQLENPTRAATGFLRERLGIDTPILMYVGNLQPYQGVDLLLDSCAVALGSGTRFDLVIAGGNDKDIERYRGRAKELGIDRRIHFLGPWPVDELDVLLAEADILTAPRIKGVNTPMKVFPYMHTGKPVLVTDLKTHSQILDSSVAVLAPPEPEGFGREISRLVEDEGLRDRIGRRGHEFVEKGHTYPAHRARVARLYAFVAEAAGLDADHSVSLGA